MAHASRTIAATPGEGMRGPGKRLGIQQLGNRGFSNDRRLARLARGPPELRPRAWPAVTRDEVVAGFVSEGERLELPPADARSGEPRVLIELIAGRTRTERDG